MIGSFFMHIKQKLKMTSSTLARKLLYICCGRIAAKFVLPIIGDE